MKVIGKFSYSVSLDISWIKHNGRPWFILVTGSGYGQFHDVYASIRLLVQFSLHKTAEPLSGFDCTSKIRWMIKPECHNEGETERGTLEYLFQNRRTRLRRCCAASSPGSWCAEQRAFESCGGRPSRVTTSGRGGKAGSVSFEETKIKLGSVYSALLQ